MDEYKNAILTDSNYFSVAEQLKEQSEGIIGVLTVDTDKGSAVFKHNDKQLTFKDLEEIEVTDAEVHINDGAHFFSFDVRKER